MFRKKSQVLNWFSNLRQQSPGSDNSNYTVVKIDGEKVKLCPNALEVSEEWSDDLFEGALKLHYFRLRQQEARNELVPHTELYNIRSH